MSTTGIILSQQSEERELHRRREALAALELQIAQAEPLLTQLQAEMRSFESRYLSVIGSRFDQLAEIEKEIAKWQGLEVEDDAEAESPADDQAGCGQNRFYSGKLKKLYREVARKFHPDLTSCEHERRHRHQLMVEVNRAYQAGAEERLRELLEAGAGIEEATNNVAWSAEMIVLVRHIAEAKERLVSIEAGISEIRSSEIYKLKLRVETAQSMGLDLMADLVAQVERQIKKALNRLEHLK